MGLTLFTTTRGRKEGKWVPRKNHQDKLLKILDFHCTIVARHPSYYVWTTAGASSMTFDSAATLDDYPTQII